jgi:hypothetical protein
MVQVDKSAIIAADKSTLHFEKLRGILAKRNKNPIPLKETWGSSIQAYSPRFGIFLTKDLYYRQV